MVEISTDGPEAADDGHEGGVLTPLIGGLSERVGHVRDEPLVQRDPELILVYLGGDREACRLWTERNTVDPGGHRGFVRLALRTGVPVVPVVTHGPMTPSSSCPAASDRRRCSGCAVSGPWYSRSCSRPAASPPS